jgi:hypothetical protein
MELSEVIFDLGIKGSRSHRDYNSMVTNWYVEENNPIPSLELCTQTWNNVSLIRLRNQRKLERIFEVKELANLELLKTDWKVIKHQELNYLTETQFNNLKNERQSIRDLSNTIETEINNLETLELVNNYNISFE